MREGIKSLICTELYIEVLVKGSQQPIFKTTNACVLIAALKSSAITQRVSKLSRVIGPCLKPFLPPSVTGFICATEACTQNNSNRNDVYILPVFCFQLNILATIYIVEWHGIYTIQFDVTSW